MKPKIHLTALSNDIFNDNDLILGEWCIPDSNKKFLPYHWDDKERMHSDFKLIDNIYEELLIIFKDILNEHHKKLFFKILASFNRKLASYNFTYYS